MNTTKRTFLAALCFCLLAGSAVWAQTNNGAPAPSELNITVGEQRLKFAPTRAFVEMRLNVFNSQGELVYGAATAEAELQWPVKNNNDEALTSGLYAYVLTLKYGENDERQHRGHFIIEKGQDQIWLTAQDGAEVSGTALNATRASGRSIAGLRTADEKAPKRDVEGRELASTKDDAATSSTKPVAREKSALTATLDTVAKFNGSGTANQDTNIQHITSTNHLGFGVPASSTTPLLFNGDLSTGVLGAGLPSFILQSNSDHARLEMRQAGAGAPIVQGRSSGGTLLAPTPSPLNQILGGFGGSGHDGAGYATISHGFIGIKAGELWTPTAHGAYITFDTTKNGLSTRTEKMRITGDGNALFGTTVANGARVRVFAPTNPNIQLSTNANPPSSTTGATLEFGIATCAGCYSNIATPNDAVIRSDADDTEDLIIAARSWTANPLAGAIRFTTGTQATEAERVTILKNGDTGVGINNPAHRFEIYEVDPTNAPAYQHIRFTTGSTSSSYRLDVGVNNDGVNFENTSLIRGFNFKNGNGSLVSITQNGDVLPGADNTRDLGSSGLRWNEIYLSGGVLNGSDMRLKNHITGLNYGVKSLMRLRPVSYTWKNSSDGKVSLGLLAQEVEKVVPEVVHHGANPDEMMSINYISLVPVLIKAVQEQQTMLVRKEVQLNKLQKRVNALERRANQRH